MKDNRSLIYMLQNSLINNQDEWSSTSLLQYSILLDCPKPTKQEHCSHRSVNKSLYSLVTVAEHWKSSKVQNIYFDKALSDKFDNDCRVHHTQENITKAKLKYNSMQ